MSDLSPIASSIAVTYNLDFDARRFEQAARAILDEVWHDVAWMYATPHSDGRVGTINYTVWSEVFACSGFAGSVTFVEVALDPATNKYSDSFACPNCGRFTEFRTEAVLAGFKDAYDRDGYASIVAVAEKLPVSVLQEDEKLLMYYDVAQMRTGDWGHGRI